MWIWCGNQFQVNVSTSWIYVLHPLFPIIAEWTIFTNQLHFPKLESTLVRMREKRAHAKYKYSNAFISHRPSPDCFHASTFFGAFLKSQSIWFGFRTEASVSFNNSYGLSSIALVAMLTWLPKNCLHSVGTENHATAIIRLQSLPPPSADVI